MTITLALKLFLVPLLIWGVTLAGRKWGPMVAGWLSAFPIVAGPILLIISLEQGTDFAAHAAQATLLAVLAMVAFSLSYAWASARFGVAGSMLCGFLTWLSAAHGLQSTALPVTLSFGLVLVALLLAPRLFPAMTAPPASGARPNDLPWRMLAGAVLVLLVTLCAARLGARWSGFLAMFPVMGSVLSGFSHHYSGRAFAVTLLRGTMFGFFAFATFCLLLALLLPRQGIAASFALAFLAALVVQLLVRAWMTRLSANPSGAEPPNASPR